MVIEISASAIHRAVADSLREVLIFSIYQFLMVKQAAKVEKRSLCRPDIKKAEIKSTGYD